MVTAATLAVPHAIWALGPVRDDGPIGELISEFRELTDPSGAFERGTRERKPMSGDDTVRKAAGAAKSAAGEAQQAGREVAGSKWFRILVSVGLVAYGIVHILIGWLALQIALAGFGTGGGGGEEASQEGALAEIAEQPFGAVLLWAIVVGLFAMAAWQLMEAGWGHLDRPAGVKRIRKRISSVGRAIAYIVLGIAAFGAAQGSPETGDSSEEGLTARLLAAPFGRILVIALGVGVLALGVR